MFTDIKAQRKTGIYAYSAYGVYLVGRSKVINGFVDTLIIVQVEKYTWPEIKPQVIGRAYPEKR